MTHTRTLQAVSRTAWNELSRDSFYLSHDWLSWVEDAGGADAMYLLREGDDALLGALPLYDVHNETNDEYVPSRWFDGRWQGRYLLGGSRRAYTNEVLVRQAADAPAVIEELLVAAEAAAADAQSDGVLFLFLSTAAALALQRARPDLDALLAVADMALEVPGETFDDYLSALPRQRRKQVRRERKHFLAAGYTVGVERLSDCFAEAGPLVAAVQRRYGHAADDAHFADFLAGQAKALDDYSIVFTCRRDGRLVGCALAFGWCGTLYSRMVGFDYPALSDSWEYFNLLYYEPLEYAYRNGLRRIHLGWGTSEAKLRRGATFELLWHVLLPQGRDSVAPGAAPASDVNCAQRERLNAELRQEVDLGAMAGISA